MPSKNLKKIKANDSIVLMCTKTNRVFETSRIAWYDTRDNIYGYPLGENCTVNIPKHWCKELKGAELRLAIALFGTPNE